MGAEGPCAAAFSRILPAAAGRAAAAAAAAAAATRVVVVAAVACVPGGGCFVGFDESADGPEIKKMDAF